MGDSIKRIKKLREPRGIGVFFIIAIPVIIFISWREECDPNFWKNLSEILIVVLIFAISALWAVRTSAFYSSAQERNNFYHYMVDYEVDYGNINRTNLRNIIEDPASQYLFSSRVRRADAIIYNMIFFYLFICLVFLFIQFLFNLKEGNITIWFYILIFLAISVICYLAYKIKFEAKNIRKRLKKIRDFFPIEIGILIVLCIILLIYYVLYRNFYPQHILKICRYEFTTVLSLINILLFLIALYLVYLASRVHYLARSKYDIYNEFIIWTHDNMDIIPFLKGKDDPDRHPVVKKEKEMINLWKWSLMINLKKIFGEMDKKGNVGGNYRINKEHVENLCGALTASEWGDPSIIYICAIVGKLFSHLKIDDCSVSNESRRNSRDDLVKKAAEKRWRDKKKELKKLKKDLENLMENEKNDLDFENKKRKKECEIKKLREEIFYKRCEIKCLEELFANIDKIAETIDRDDPSNFESVKGIIENICFYLIKIYKNRTKN